MTTQMKYIPGRDYLNVWKGFPEDGLEDAKAYATALRNERPNLQVAICGTLAQSVTERERVKAQRAGHRWLVGIFDKPAPNVRIPGINA